MLWDCTTLSPLEGQALQIDTCNTQTEKVNGQLIPKEEFDHSLNVDAKEVHWLLLLMLFLYIDLNINICLLPGKV